MTLETCSKCFKGSQLDPGQCPILRPCCHDTYLQLSAAWLVLHLVVTGNVLLRWKEATCSRRIAKTRHRKGMKRPLVHEGYVCNFGIAVCVCSNFLLYGNIEFQTLGPKSKHQPKAWCNGCNSQT